MPAALAHWTHAKRDLERDGRVDITEIGKPKIPFKTGIYAV